MARKPGPLIIQYSLMLLVVTVVVTVPACCKVRFPRESKKKNTTTQSSFCALFEEAATRTVLTRACNKNEL
jgi:hypothetical protein